MKNYIGERIGYDIEFVDMSFDTLIPSVVNGEADCAVSAITVTEERESIDIANELGITYKSKQYIYKNNITREEFCEFIYNLIVLVNQDVTSFVHNSFTDAENEKVLRLNSSIDAAIVK